jgi:hypothetical protein
MADFKLFLLCNELHRAKRYFVECGRNAPWSLAKVDSTLTLAV